MAGYYLRLSVIDRCNLACNYCRPAGQRYASGPAPLSDSRLLELLGALDAQLPLTKLRLTGGEPLLRPGLPALVERLRARFPTIELCLTTNGTLLPRLAGPLRAAGLDRLNISLDAAEPNAYRASTGGDLTHALAGLEAALEAGFQAPRLNCVLQRSVNQGGLASLVRLALAKGASLRFIELMPLGPAKDIFKEQHLPASEALEELGRDFRHLGFSGQRGTASWHRFADGGREFELGFITPVSKPFCETCDRLRMDIRGVLYSCLRVATGVDLATALELDGSLAGALGGLLGGGRVPGRVWPSRPMHRIGG
jgi:cyclic pyranopterin phosphate synthase